MAYNPIKYSNFRVRYQIWLESGEGVPVLDDGTWALLKAIGELGSLRKAAEAMQISYRKAWGDMRKADRLLGFPLVERRRGGAGGGETHLSEEGQAFVRAYGQFHREFDEAVQSAVIRLKRKLKGKD